MDVFPPSSLATQQMFVDTAWASLCGHLGCRDGDLWSSSGDCTPPKSSEPSFLGSFADSSPSPPPPRNCWVPGVYPLLTWVSQNLRGSLRPLLADAQDM